jgi:hypothetical protein
LEENPFGDPLFDSLEMDEPVAAPYDHDAPDAQTEPPTFVFEAEDSIPPGPDDRDFDESDRW